MKGKKMLKMSWVERLKGSLHGLLIISFGNFGKTKSILFGSAAKLRKSSRLEVVLIITSQQGVSGILDNKLTGENMAVFDH